MIHNTPPPNDITLEQVVKLRKDIMEAREQSKLLRRNGFFDLNLKTQLKEKEKELATIGNQLYSRNAWKPL